MSPDNHVIYSNRSAAFCKGNRYKEALEDAEAAIRIKPDWAKVIVIIETIVLVLYPICKQNQFRKDVMYGISNGCTCIM